MSDMSKTGSFSSKELSYANKFLLNMSYRKKDKINQAVAVRYHHDQDAIKSFEEYIKAPLFLALEDLICEISIKNKRVIAKILSDSLECLVMTHLIQKECSSSFADNKKSTEC